MNSDIRGHDLILSSMCAKDDTTNWKGMEELTHWLLANLKEILDKQF